MKETLRSVDQLGDFFFAFAEFLLQMAKHFFFLALGIG
jgi:hypothetical protein